MNCIFVDIPEECTQRDNSGCFKLNLLRCLSNHLHLKLTEEGKSAVREQLELDINRGTRYKEKSGWGGRKLT